MRQKRLIFILTAAAFIAEPSRAQDFGPPDISEGVFAFFATEFGDVRSAALLNQVFGPLYPAAGGGARATPFSVLIGVINLALLAVGGLLLAYNITAGLLQSAHEGELLGRRDKGGAAQRFRRRKNISSRCNHCPSETWDRRKSVNRQKIRFSENKILKAGKGGS